MKSRPEIQPSPQRPTLSMCPHCRAALPVESRFCGFCGKSTSIDAVAAELEGPRKRVMTPPPMTLARPPAPPMTSASGSGSFASLKRDTIVDARPPWFEPVDRPTVEVMTAGAMIGEWRVECLLGMGTMGAVYGAIHPQIGRKVAIKVLRRERLGDAEATARFVQEAQAASRVRHANVVDVHTLGRLSDGRAYFVMEWIDGETLRERLGRPLSLTEVCLLTEQLCDALAALHAGGVVHRDIKPDNVLLQHTRSPDGPIAKLLDLGLAKLTDRGQGSTRLTMDGFVVGSAEYVSPEQAAGHAVDPRSDVYSLGVVLFELLTRRRPFDAPTPTDLLVEHMIEPAPAPSSFDPSLPRELDRLVLAMLAKEPGDRPALADVRAVLALWRRGMAVGSPVEPRRAGPEQKTLVGESPALPDAPMQATLIPPEPSVTVDMRAEAEPDPEPRPRAAPLPRPPAVDRTDVVRPPPNELRVPAWAEPMPSPRELGSGRWVWILAVAVGLLAGAAVAYLRFR